MTAQAVMEQVVMEAVMVLAVMAGLVMMAGAKEGAATAAEMAVAEIVAMAAMKAGHKGMKVGASKTRQKSNH